MPRKKYILSERHAALEGVSLEQQWVPMAANLKKSDNIDVDY